MSSAERCWVHGTLVNITQAAYYARLIPSISLEVPIMHIKCVTSELTVTLQQEDTSRLTQDMKVYNV